MKDLEEAEVLNGGYGGYSPKCEDLDAISAFNIRGTFDKLSPNSPLLCLRLLLLCIITISVSAAYSAYLIRQPDVSRNALSFTAVLSYFLP